MREGVEFAEDTMVGQMKELWKECFGDSDDYIKFYYKNRFQKENTLVYCIKEEVVSMMAILPAQIKRGEMYQSVRYIYALATKKEYRGHGYAKKLLEEGETRINEPLILIPATPSLFSFYKKLGFQTNFYLSAIRKKMSDIQTDKRKIRIAGAREYKQIRDKKLEREGYVKWDRQAIQYAIEENRRQQGEAYIIENSDTKEKDILLVREKETSLEVLEISGVKENLFSIPEELKNRYQTKEIVIFHVPKQETSDLKHIETAFAMSKGLDLEEGYFNLGLQ